jgi:flagellar biosynthetic protein FliR
MVISVIQAQLFFLALTRILIILSTIPVLGGQSIPAQFRIAFGFVLAIILVPWQPLPANAEAMGLLSFAFAIFKELIIGLLAGFAGILTFGVTQIAGEVMGLGSGFGSSRVFNPAMSEASSAFNQLFTIVALMLFLVTNSHHIVIAALAKTFEVIPVNGDIPLNSLPIVAQMTSQLVAAGIQIAFPVMVSLTLTDIALGLIARVAPQVQIYFLGLPLKVGVSLFALGTLMMIIFPAVETLFGETGNRMLQLLGK